MVLLQPEKKEANGEMYANCLMMFTGQTEKCSSRLVYITIWEVHEDAEISYIYKTCWLEIDIEASTPTLQLILRGSFFVEWESLPEDE